MRSIVTLSLLFFGLSCGGGGSTSNTTYYSVKSLDDCIESSETCLYEIKKPKLSQNINLVKLQYTSEVYKSLSIDNIRSEDSATFESAAIIKTAETLNEISKNWPLNNPVYIDPYCEHPDSQHNGFYRKMYGHESISLENTICLGLTFHKTQGVIPLAFDPAVLAHEYYHVIFSEAFLENDTLLKILNENHDLLAFNEGMADHFAYSLFGDFNSWFITERKLNWRTEKGRNSVHESSEFHGNIYKDGQRWTEFANLAKSNGIDTISASVCMLNDLKEKTKKSLLKKYWNRIITNEDILDSFETCLVDNKELFKKAKEKLFYHEIKKEKLMTSVDLSLVVISNAKALCEFSKIYDLDPSQLKYNQYINPCDNLTSLTYKQQPLKFGDPEISFQAGREKELVYIVVGAKPNGEGNDCRLRGDTGTMSEIALGSDHGVEMTPFTNIFFQNDIGSSYRDIGFGNFDSHTSFRAKKIISPLEEKGYRFISYNNSIGLSSGINGYTLLPTVVVGDSKKEKNEYLSEKVKSVFSTFHRNNEGQKCIAGTSGCFARQNFFMECNSHLKSNDQHTMKEPQIIKTKNVEVSVFECNDSGCQLNDIK